MKSSLTLFIVTLFALHAHAQSWTGTHFGDGSLTYTAFEQTAWGAHHALLFNAHPRSPQNNGTFQDNSNVEFQYGPGSYGNGAGAIMFLGNGGRMDFLVSGASTGAGNAVTWSPAMTITRGNVIGISQIDPKFALHVSGNNPRSAQMTLGSTATGNFAITDALGGAYGLYVGVNGTGNTWMQGGRHDGNTAAYDISLNAAGGNILIGQASCAGCTYRLNVAGRARVNEVVVNSDGSDFVFYSDYRLRPLSEVEQFIKENQHLPEIESAKEMQTNGLEVGKMETKLLQKVEELTLYMIDLQKQVDQLKEENQKLKKRK